MDKPEKYYDILAKAIRCLINLSPDYENIYAIPNTIEAERTNQINKILYEDNIDLLERFNEILNQSQMDPLSLSLSISILDDCIYKYLESWMDLQFYDDDIIQCNGLNSDHSQAETGILLIPRFTCIWEGKSGAANHSIDVNTFLNHTYIIMLKNGMLDGKYKITNHILPDSLYGINLNSQNELSTGLGISPVTEDINLTCETYIKNINGNETNCFSVKNHTSDTADSLEAFIERILQKADALGINIFVFPEMLGTNHMAEKISNMLQRNSFENIRLFVLPSIWDHNIGNPDNSNYSFVMNYYGDILFAQHKLKRYPYYDSNTGEYYMEDIQVADIIHLIHLKGYGSAAVSICRSQLDTETRNLFIHKLNVKLLLCPSWSQGNSFEFETSIMSGAENCCNTVWCNTCSALNNKNNPDKTVGIITGYGKNHSFSQLDFANRKFPNEKYDCRHNCNNGCIFQAKIYGSNYHPDKEEGTLI